MQIQTMELLSPAFFIGSTIPFEFTCDGDNVSPPLGWDLPPDGTVSFALTVEDPDAPNGTFIHWLVYDMPANLRHLPQGITDQPTLEGGGVQGRNDFGNLGYGGPCPPNGETHRYFFKLYALDQILGLAAGASYADLKAAIADHVLASVELMGRYARQGS